MPTEEPGVVSFPIEPLDGHWGLTPPAKIPAGGSPDMVNCYVRGDTLRKRPGFHKLGNRLSATERVMGLYDAWDDEDNVFLFASTQTGIKRYIAGSDTWTAYTGPALTGGTERKFQWTISQNAVVFGNGTDQIMKIPFTGTSYAILNVNCPPAKYIARFADRLYIAHTVETGATKPFRIRRSVNADHTDWTGTGSGFNDLAEYPYHIKGLVKQASGLMVPSEQAIWLATRTGVAAAPARFDPLVPGIGVYMPYTLTTLQNDQLFYGRDHAYLFSGNTAREVVQQVRDIIFFNLSASKIHLNHSIIRPESQEWLTFITEPAQIAPNVVWVWNYHYNVAYKWELGQFVICSEIHRQDIDRTWTSLIGDWDSQTWQWTVSEGIQNFPILLTGHTNGYVYQWKEEFLDDDGSVIPCRWSSKDWSSGVLSPPNAKNQIHLKDLAIEYQACGCPCTLDFFLSTDGGDNWVGPYSVTLTQNLESSGYFTVTLGEQISGDRIRWKFENSVIDENFRISRFIPTFEILGSLISDASA